MEVNQLTKYKTKEEKKKARQARRKIHRAALAATTGNNMTTTDGKCKLNTKTQTQSLKNSSSECPQKSSVPKQLNKNATAERESTRSYAKKFRHLAVAIYRDDGLPVDKSLATLIRKRLTDLIYVEVVKVLNDSNASAPRFVMSGLVEAGFFLVTPKNTESRDWLVACDFGLLDGKGVFAKKLERRGRKSRGKDLAIQNTVPDNICSE